MEVNNELDVLEKFLEQTQEVIKPGGRLVVMSYHSLEDRLVKNYMKRGNFEGVVEKDFFGNILKPFEEVNRKPISPSEAEIELNTRARSAKLRIAERVKDGK
jgi:16S rRNA (cytosine1402-N4)-methyltransferase